MKRARPLGGLLLVAGMFLATSLTMWTSVAAAARQLRLWSADCPVRTGWDFESEAQGDTNGCDPGTTAALQRKSFADDWDLRVANLTPFGLLPGEAVDRVYVDVKAGSEDGTGDCAACGNTLPVGLGIRFVSNGSTVDGPTVNWSGNINCRFRWRDTQGGLGWDITDALKAANGGTITAAVVNGLQPQVRRSGASGNQNLKVDAFQVTVTTISIPSPPASISASNPTASTISVSWAASGGDPAVDYVLERSINGGGFAYLNTINAPTTSYLDTGLPELTNCTYRVYARNAAGSSGYSPTASNTTKNTAHHLAWVQHPTNGNAVTALSPAVTIRIEDSLNRLVADATNAVTLGFASNPGGATPSGFGPVAAVGGTATFSAVVVNRTGTGYTLNATSAGLPNPNLGASNAFDIVPGPPFQLAFSTQPSSAPAGLPFGAVVEIRDAAGNWVSTATNTIGLAVNATCGDVLHGTVSAQAVNGHAEFPGAYFQSVCANYTVQATSSGLIPITSNPFGIVPGAPQSLAFLVQPSDVALGRPMATVTVALRDAFNNTATNSSLPITITLSTGCGGILAGGEARAPTAGVAMFDNLQVSKACGNYSLRAGASGVAPAFSSFFSGLLFQSSGGDLLAGGFGFDDFGGACNSRGWVGEPLDTTIFAHLSGRFLVNSGGISMGSTALWFGADSTSAPAETKNWVYGTGFGNGWSQRLVSPTFNATVPANRNAVLSFDASLDFTNAAGLLDGDRGNEFLAAQVLDVSGQWRFLVAQFTPSGGAMSIDTSRAGKGVLSCQAFLNADGNQSLSLGASARVRIVVQTDSLGSAEDGGVSPGAGAAVVDNVKLLAGVTPVVPSLNFDTGGLQTWTLSARNGLWRAPAENANFTRDVAARRTSVALLPGSRFGEDDNGDPTCVWSFLATGDTLVADGTYARLRSPWMPRYAQSQSAVLTLSARLNTVDQRRAVKLFALGKNAGDTRPRFFARASSRLAGSTQGGDGGTAFQTGIPFAFPSDFLGATNCDSLQFVVLVADIAEASPAGFAGRPATALPLFDDFSLTVIGADEDQDGVANVNGADGCTSASATRHDADGNGCPDGYATFTNSRFWATQDRPLHFRFTATGDSSITDGSEFTTVRAAVAAWQNVAGTTVNIVEDAPVARSAASSEDGINLVTWTDGLSSEGFGFPAGVIALTSRKFFTQQSAYGDRLVIPGRIVDSDIRFNPAFLYGTPTTGSIPGAIDLYSVALHEFGHLLGLAHSSVVRATMYPQIGPETASLEEDDRAALASRFPSASQLSAQFGSIEGTAVRGGTLVPLRQARVVAIQLGAGNAFTDTVATDYTDDQGHYHLWRLAPGSYAVRLDPVGEFEMSYVDSAFRNTADRNFEGEWWNLTESGTDSLVAFTPINLVAGQARTDANLTTNIDNLPPFVARALPANDANNVPTDAGVTLEFSEPINFNSVKNAFTLTPRPSGPAVLGRKALIEGTRFVFIPYSPLSWGTTYDLTVDGATLLDANNNPMGTTFSTSFATPTAPSSVLLTGIYPDPAPAGGLVTLTGDGFVTLDSTQNAVTFPGCGACGTSYPVAVSPHRIVVAIPAAAQTGNITVTVGGQSSSILSHRAQDPATAAPGVLSSVDLRAYSPRDVALAPGDVWALVAARTGFVRTNGTAIVTYNATGPLEAIVASTRNRRAYATSPDSGFVWVLGADAAAGTLGQPIERLRLGGRPTGLAVRADGRRLYVTDTERNSVHEFDVSGDSLRALRRFDFGSNALAGAIALDPIGNTLLLDTRGSGAVRFDALAETTVVLGTGTPEAGERGSVVSTPQGDEFLFASATAGVRSIRNGYTVSPLAGLVSMGARTRDVSVLPGGRLALVADAGRNQLAVVSLDQAGGSYHKIVGAADIAGSPIAVAVDSAGTGGVVLASGSGFLTFFSLAPNAQLHAVSPPVAAPGDLVAGLSGPANLPGSLTVNVAQAQRPTTSVIDSSFSFVVPAVEPQATTVSAVPAGGGAPTAPLPFRIVNSIPSHMTRSLGVSLATPLDSCQAGVIGYRPLRAVVASPRGDLVATLGGTVNLGACSLDAAATFWRADDRDTIPLGSFVRTVTLGSGRNVVAAGFSPDGRDLWVALASGGTGEVRVLDTTNPAPASVGTLRLTVPNGVVGDVSALAIDPLGRLVATASQSAGTVTVLRRNGSLVQTFSMGIHTPRSLAFSRDGRTLVVGGEDRTWFYETTNFGLVQSSSPHPGQAVIALATPTHGDRIAGLVLPATLGVWNVDPTEDPIGTQYFYGTLSAVGSDSLASLAAAPDGVSVLAPVARRDVLYRLDVSGASPLVRSRPPGHRESVLARSADGRLAWSSNAPAPGATNGPAVADSVRLYSLVPDSTLRLTAGGGQAGLVSTTLPVPVRVRVTDGSGEPAAGVFVSFTRSGPGGGGQLDGDALRATLFRLTDQNGFAAVTWKLPAVSGVDTVRVALASGLLPLTVLARASGADAGTNPEILATGPTNGQSNLLANSSLFVTFSQKMQLGALGATVTSGGLPLAGVWSPLDEGRTLVFVPQRAFPYGAHVVLTIPAGALDTDDDPLLTPKVVAFDIEPIPALGLSYVQPAAVPAGGVVNLIGHGFTATPEDHEVVFGDRAGIVLHASSTLLEVQLPGDIVPGTVSVSVRRKPAGAWATVPSLSVLPADPSGALSSASLAARRGGHSIAIAPGTQPDHARAYVVTPDAGSVHVYDVTKSAMTWLATIAVGDQPVAIALHPAGLFAYVANAGSRDLSVIGVNPGDPATYHQVVKTVALSEPPVSLDVASTAAGEFVLVVTGSESSTLLTVDARPSSATLNTVVKQATTTSSATVAGTVSQLDGGYAFLWTSGSVYQFSFEKNAIDDSLTAMGHVTALEVDRARRGLLYGIRDDGSIVVLDLAPTSSYYRRVIQTLQVPGGAATLRSTPDGTLCVTSRQDDMLYNFNITRLGGFGAGGVSDGPLAVQVLSAVPTGQSPAGIAVDPTGSFVLVANEGSASTTRLDLDVAPPVALRLDLQLDRFDLDDFGQWYTGYVSAGSDSLADLVDVASVRLSDLVPADTLGPSPLSDIDGDGTLERGVSFVRDQILSVVPQGNFVVMSASGRMGDRDFVARDTLQVRRSEFFMPSPGARVPSNSTAYLFYDWTADSSADHVAVMFSVNGGRTWARAFTHYPKGQRVAWPTPSVETDSAMVAIVMVDSVTSDTSVVRGVLAMSGRFHVGGITETDFAAPPQVALARVSPNPSLGSALFRFGLPQRAEAALEIFDVQGRLVRSLSRGPHDAGWHELRWAGEGTRGARARSGVYFVRLRAEGIQRVQRFVWLP